MPQRKWKINEDPEDALWQSVSHSEYERYILHFTCSHTAHSQCHFNLKYNQKSRKTGSKSVAKGIRHSATQASDWLRLCGSNPLSTVVNLLHCRLLSPDSTDCTPRALQSPIKYCCLSGTSQLQFSSFCLAKMSYNATHI